jgi:bifunctional non-homologous end joining protein LigD
MDGRFVVHEHQGRRRHYDFRLEIDGVLKSWALPKGPSMNPSQRRLAIMVADHPLEYIDFEGVIPAGEYGAGPVVIWDSGTFSIAGSERAAAQLQRGELLFVLHGAKLRGGFALVRLERGDATDWLLIKRKDSAADATWQLESVLTPQRRRSLVERLPPCGG